MSKKGEYMGKGRVSVDCGPDGWFLSVDGDGERFSYEMDQEGSIELAACFFFAAMCMPGADPEKMTAQFTAFLEQKAHAYERAQAEQYRPKGLLS